VGGGSRYDGAARVTQTMRRLGLANFYLCAPFQEVQWDDGSSGYAGLGNLVWTANSNWLQESKTPGYDRCVRATPREMATLLEMIYRGSQGEGLLRDAYPNIFKPQICQDMIDIMAANDLRNMLGAGIPAEVKLAHKHGFSGYAVPWGDTRAEVGIVFSPGADWLISFYIWEDTDWINWGINQPLYRDVSNMLYNYFNPQEPFWPLPPWAPEPETESDSDSNA
jgi:beta-lactamase class A